MALTHGDKFGKLTVLGRLALPGKVKYECRCDCGNQIFVRSDHLLSGATQSCGCLKEKTSGWYKTATYASWTSMRQRCTNSKASKFSNYGGRGIKICDRWLESFENFLADMGERPAGKTLDRCENNGNYEPGNCKWSTPKEQARNRRSNRHVVVDGETMTMTAAAEVLGVNMTTLKYQLDKEGL